MIYSEILEDIEACRNKIEEDFEIDLSDNVKEVKVLLRGENFPYPKTESSMKRFLTDEVRKTMRPFNIVSPFIDFEDLYAEFLVHEYGIDSEQAAGFLQHYGFPTDLFDFSPSFDMARFFASYGRESDNVAVIGVFHRLEMDGYFRITDLSGHPIGARPTRQNAYVARPGPGIIDIKSPLLDRLFTVKWYKFYKSDDDLQYAKRHVSNVYPNEEELLYFFPDDLVKFVADHFTRKYRSAEEATAVFDAIERIRSQLTSH